MDISLFSKVALLLTMSMSFGGLGCWLARNQAGIKYFCVTALAMFIGIFVVIGMTSVSSAAGIAALAGWTFITGLFIGPAIHSYSEDIGWQTVALAFFGSAGVMAICGMFAIFSGINFSGMGSFLGIGLFGLILVGIVGIFFKWSRGGNILYSLFGMLIFSGYFVYDFFTLGHTENTWQNATELTMKLYLDYLNFLLHLLALLAQLHQHN